MIGAPCAAALAVGNWTMGTTRMATTGRTMTFGTAMPDADYVMIDGVMFLTEYLRVPDRHTVADDIVLEARNGDTEVTLTREDVDGAQHLGEGALSTEVGRAIAPAVVRDDPLTTATAERCRSCRRARPLRGRAQGRAPSSAARACPSATRRAPDRGRPHHPRCRSAS